MCVDMKNVDSGEQAVPLQVDSDGMVHVRCIIGHGQLQKSTFTTR